MNKLLSADFARLGKDTFFRIGMVFMFIIGIFRPVSIYCDMVRWELTVPFDGGFFVYVVFVVILASVFCSLFIGTEYSDGTIRNKIAAGHGRVTIYLANLLTVCMACLLFTAVYLLATLAVGLPVLGSLTLSGGVILTTLLGTLATAAAFCALYTLTGMCVSRKSTGCILCILLFFGMMIASTYLAAMLDMPEEHLVMSMVDGEIVSHMEPNPRYLTENKRRLYQLGLDFLPTGQATQYVMLADKTAKMSLYSGLIVLLTTGGGMLCFRRKDIR